MGKSLKAFAASMRKRAEAMPEYASKLAVIGSEAALRELVQVTPVDTSEALSNWQIGIESRPPIDIQPHFPGSKGSTRAASSDKAIDEGLQALATKRPEQTIFISNPAKHIADLDNGSSAQFAGGFTARALIVFHAALLSSVGKMR